MDVFSKIITKCFSYKYSDVIDKFKFMSDEIAEHTLCLILFPNSKSINHWRSELINWILALKKSNNTKTKSGKVDYGPTFAALYSGPFANSFDLVRMIERANDHSSKKIDIRYINEENFRTSLSAIYDDYSKVINSMMDESEFKKRVNNYYLYQG